MSQVMEEERDRSELDTSLHLARRYIRILNPHAVFWRQGARLIAFFPVTGGIDRHSLTQALREVCQRVARENSPHSVSMGVSEVFTELRLFPSAHQNALRSLEFGRVLQGNAKGIAVHHDDLGLFQLFDTASSLN
ncbi:MAG: hypothetical protein ACUVQS_05465 [Candidatus Bipolaricaulaceae bacterium]